MTAAPVRCSAWLGVSFWVEAIANPTRKDVASAASIRMTGDERRALLDDMERSEAEDSTRAKREDSARNEPCKPANGSHSGQTWERHPLNTRRGETPNDPKLSDGGAWRGSCEGGAQKEATDVGQRWLGVKTPKPELAATVTRGAVRCSAWLGAVRFGTDVVKEFREQRSDSRWMPERECLESWDSPGAWSGEKPKTAALSRCSELLRVKRRDV